VKAFNPSLMILQLNLMKMAAQSKEDGSIQDLEKRLRFLRDSCVRSGLEISVTGIEKVINVLAHDSAGLDAHAFTRQCIEIENRIVDELSAPRFMEIPRDKVHFFTDYELFGPAVNSKFKKVADDIAEAGRCYAAGRNTATVFHLMRVMEYGVQRFGKKLGVTLVGEKNWQNILDEVNKGIKSLPEKTSRQKSRKSNYAGAAAHLFNVKLAWRNPVMHPKESYTDEEAGDVLDHVKSFMRHLADIV
jgi:hypothetical protein